MVGNYDKETGKKIVKLINEIKVKQMDYTQTMLVSEGKQVKLMDMVDERDKKEVERLLECSELYYTYKSMVDSIGKTLSDLTGRFMQSMLENEAKQDDKEFQKFKEMVAEENDEDERGEILGEYLVDFDTDDVIKVICGGNVVYYGAIKDGISPYIDGRGELDQYMDMTVVKEKHEDYVPVFYVKGE